MKGVGSLGCFALFVPQAQPVGDVYAADHQYASFGFHFAHGLRGEPSFTRRNLARLQRAPEGSGESARRRGDQVIQGRRVRGMDVGIDTVVCGDLGVDPKQDGLGLDRQVGPSQRTLDAFDSHQRAIHHRVGQA